MVKKAKRRRVSRDDVKENARKGGGSNWINLPEGVTQWEPKKPGIYNLDFLPYEVSDENHPDEIAKVGTIWYKRPFVVHHSVGPENKSVVCPRSVGKKCPIHEERAVIEKKEKARILKMKPKAREVAEKELEKLLKDLNGKRQVMFNIKDLEDADKVSVFCFSEGKFWNTMGGKGPGLKRELDEGDDDILSFFDVKDGKTVKARFSEESYEGKKFISVSKIDFKDREDLDEDDILGKVVDLDKCLNVIPYDKLKGMFLQADEKDDSDEEEESEDEDTEEDEVKPKKKAKTKKSQKEEDEEDEEDEDSDDEEEDEDESEDEEEEEDEEDEDSDDDQDEESDEDEDDEEDSDDDDDEEEVKPRKRAKAK